jgi:hypothetical protein
MPAIHNSVNEDRSTYIVPTDLTGEDVHLNFRPQAFRFAYLHNYLTLDELSNQTYDYPSILYNRMVPALRLATRLLKHATPSLMRIAFAPIVSAPTAGARRTQSLGDCWSYSPDDVWMFEN